MQFISNIKWYHILIGALLLIVLYLIVHSSHPQCKSIQKEAFDNPPTASEDTAPEIILYYANWCGFSRSFLPEWEKFESYAKTGLPDVRVSRVLCEGDNEQTCSQKGIQGFPSVVLYKPNGAEITFDDSRTSDKLIDFVKKNT